MTGRRIGGYSPGCPDCEAKRDGYGVMSGCSGPANHGEWDVTVNFNAVAFDRETVLKVVFGLPDGGAQ